MPTVPTALCRDLTACGATFVQSLLLEKKKKVHTRARTVQQPQMRRCSSSSSSLLLPRAVQDCTVLQRKAVKGRTWLKDGFSFTPVSRTVPASTCALTTLALVLCLPALCLHPLTELLRLFKRMMKSFHDTLENRLSKSGSQSLSQLLCMHFAGNTKCKMGTSAVELVS